MWECWALSFIYVNACVLPGQEGLGSLELELKVDRTHTSARTSCALTPGPLASLIDILILCACVAARAAENMTDVRINTCGAQFSTSTTWDSNSGSRSRPQAFPGAEPSSINASLQHSALTRASRHAKRTHWAQIRSQPRQTPPTKPVFPTRAVKGADCAATQSHSSKGGHQRFWGRLVEE